MKEISFLETEKRMDAVVYQCVDKEDRRLEELTLHILSFLCEIGKVIFVTKVKLGWGLELLRGDSESWKQAERLSAAEGIG